MSGSKCKSGDVACTAKKHQAPRKDEERQEEEKVTEEPKRFTDDAENGKGIFFI